MPASVKRNAKKEIKADINQLTISVSEVVTRFEQLKPREKEVAKLLVAGNKSKDIATHLCLSPATVKVHKARMMTKMQVSSLQELVFALVKSDLA